MKVNQKERRFRRGSVIWFKVCSWIGNFRRNMRNFDTGSFAKERTILELDNRCSEVPGGVFWLNIVSHIQMITVDC